MPPLYPRALSNCVTHMSMPLTPGSTLATASKGFLRWPEGQSGDWASFAAQRRTAQSLQSTNRSMSPNKSRQPTPGDRPAASRTPLARRGCALRWANMARPLISTLIALFVTSVVALAQPRGDDRPHRFARTIRDVDVEQVGAGHGRPGDRAGVAPLCARCARVRPRGRGRPGSSSIG